MAFFCEMLPILGQHPKTKPSVMSLAVLTRTSTESTWGIADEDEEEAKLEPARSTAALSCSSLGYRSKNQMADIRSPK